MTNETKDPRIETITRETEQLLNAAEAWACTIVPKGVVTSEQLLLRERSRQLYVDTSMYLLTNN